MGNFFNGGVGVCQQPAGAFLPHFIQQLLKAGALGLQVAHEGAFGQVFPGSHALQGGHLPLGLLQQHAHALGQGAAGLKTLQLQITIAKQALQGFIIGSQAGAVHQSATQHHTQLRKPKLLCCAIR